MVVAPRSALGPGVLAMRQLECDGARPVSEAVLPDAHVLLSLQYREPVVSADRYGRHRLRSHVSGAHDHRVSVSTEGAAGAILVKLHPRAAAAFLRAPPGAFVRRSVALEDVLGRSAADRLEDRLAAAGDAGARFAVVRDTLRDLGRDDAGPDLAGTAFDRLAAADGALRIEDLAADLGVSTRWMEQSFRAALGLSPKAMARVLRLHAALKGRAAGLAWSAIAADAGFADQAHLTREFRALVGHSPHAFYRAVARLESHRLNRETSRTDFFNTFFD